MLEIAQFLSREFPSVATDLSSTLKRYFQAGKLLSCTRLSSFWGVVILCDHLVLCIPQSFVARRHCAFFSTPFQPGLGPKANLSHWCSGKFHNRCSIQKAATLGSSNVYHAIFNENTKVIVKVKLSELRFWHPFWTRRRFEHFTTLSATLSWYHDAFGLGVTSNSPRFSRSGQIQGRSTVNVSYLYLYLFHDDWPTIYF